MRTINIWRVGALVLLAVVVAMTVAIADLLAPPSIGAQRMASPAPLAVNVASLDKRGDSADGPYRISLAPSWPAVQLPGSEVPPKLDLKHDYAFGRQWHTRHAAFWEQALERFKGKPDISYLEVGLFEGASFFWVLETILTDPTSRATGIDPFFREYSDIRNYGDTFFDNLKLSGEQARSTIITGFSQTELRRLPLASYDIIYIDGSHQARDVLEDAILAFRLLKKGGVLIFDDYELWWDRPPANRPQFGIDVFYTFYRGEFDVDHFGYQVMLTKKHRS